MSSPVNSSKVAARRLHATARHLKPAAAAAESYPMNHERIQSPQDTQNFIDNQFTASKATQWIDLNDPSTNNLVTRVPQSTDEELKAAVDSAQKAFKGWKETSLLARQAIMFKYTHLIRENWDRLAASITLEQGKTFGDARGDVLRGLQVAETACGITTQMTGEVLEVAKDMETRSYREPLGVVAAICPFSEYITVLVIELLLIRKPRLPRHDSPLDDSNCYRHRQHLHHQALRARPRRMHDPCGAR